MKQFFVQYLKDFKSNFNNFNAYIILGGYAGLSLLAAIYLGDYFLRESNIFNSFFVMQPMILMLIIPAITMRSWAEEIKSGTIELLLTQPISYFSLVSAKFFAALTFFGVMLLFSVPFLFITNKFAILDYGVVSLGYLGVFFCGALFIAAGCLISSYNKNIILSYICSIFFIFFITQFEAGSLHFNTFILSFQNLNFEDNYDAFLSGVVAWSNVLYFIVYISLLLWLNTVTIEFKRAGNLFNKNKYFLFILLVILFFTFFSASSGLFFNTTHDLTSSQKFKLTKKTEQALADTEKRIDITLYQSKNKREEANSSYAVYADFVERFLKLIEKKSQGAVRTDIIRVEPFSNQELEIIRNKTPYDEDNLGNKSYMMADFSDNDGHHQTINAFNNLRQDLLETDIMRVIYRFGSDKKQIAFITDEDTSQIEAFYNTLKEFYEITDLTFNVNFIPPTYNAVIVINPRSLSFEFLVALEQYVLNGGNLIIFAEPNRTIRDNDNILKKFLENFGITPIVGKVLSYTSGKQTLEGGPATVEKNDYWQDVRSVFVNNVGKVALKPGSQYTVNPILFFDKHPIGAVSQGIYVTDYLEMAAKISAIEPVSTAPGKVFFFYDVDMIKNYLYISELSKGTRFYEIIPFADNMIFILKLLNYATDEQVENQLTYRHYLLNSSSIGSSLLRNIKDRYEQQSQEFQAELDQYNKKQQKLRYLFAEQGFASAKNMEDMNHIAQHIEEIQNNLNKIKSLIISDYQVIIMVFTIVSILVIPTVLLLIMALIIYISRRSKSKKIRSLMDNA